VGVGEGEQRLSVSAASMASVTKSKVGARRRVGRALHDEGGIKEVRTVLRFLYHGAWEGAPWRRAARWCRPSRRRLGRPRWEKTSGWARVGYAGQQANARFLGRQRKDGPEG
jgi:hypothetical protein